MAITPRPAIRIGVYGPDLGAGERHGCGLWPAGVPASITAAEGVPLQLPEDNERSWGEVLEGIHGVVVVGTDHYPAAASPTPKRGQLVPRPQRARAGHRPRPAHHQHGARRHGAQRPAARPARGAPAPPPAGTRPSSRHQRSAGHLPVRAVRRGRGSRQQRTPSRRGAPARGFRPAAVALDGVIEAIESANDWWALGVQWNPTSSTSSGLDIQLFRGLIQACVARLESVGVEVEEPVVAGKG